MVQPYSNVTFLSLVQTLINVAWHDASRVVHITELPHYQLSCLSKYRFTYSSEVCLVIIYLWKYTALFKVSPHHFSLLTSEDHFRLYNKYLFPPVPAEHTIEPNIISRTIIVSSMLDPTLRILYNKPKQFSALYYDVGVIFNNCLITSLLALTVYY